MCDTAIRFEIPAS